MTAPLAHRAVVIGASMAGLLAARALAEHFTEVVLLERDRLPDEPCLRKGTPHAAHAHGLLARGREAIETLLPGFTEALRAQGAVFGDIGTGVAFEADRLRFAPRPTGHVCFAASRPAIEAEVRRRVRALPQVHLLDGVEAIEPEFGAGGVRGVRWAAREPGALPQHLSAALVVDCSGRASRAPQWLRAWGYAAPHEQRVPVGISYATAYFERDASAVALPAIVCTATPSLPRPAVVLAQEPDASGRPRWVMTLGGYGDDGAAPTPEAMRRRARETHPPEFVALAERGARLGDVLHYRFAHSQRRRYERLRRFPHGFLVLGDAITSFNPIYGQGMTVAACEALALAEALRGGLQGLHRRFFPAAARIIDTPWQLAVGNDLGLPCVDAPCPLPVRLVNAWVARVFRAAVHDAEVAAAFARVMHLLAPPPSLFAPRIVWRVLRHGGTPPASATEPTAVAS